MVQAKYILLALLELSAQHGEDWWIVPFGTNKGGVNRLFVEKNSVTTADGKKTFWISEDLDPALSFEVRKVEMVEVDCVNPQFRGLKWRWTDRKGQQTQNDDADERWNVVTLGSPMEAARTFVCFFPPAGSMRVTGTQ